MTVSDAPVLGRYLNRLSVDVTPDEARRRAKESPQDVIALLDALVAAHAEAICFENVDVLLDRPVSVAPQDVAAKLLEAGRGGYCHEQATLVRTVLTELGLDCHPVLARILLRDSPEPGPFSHQATIVTVGVRRVLFDPGFGAGTPTVTLPVGSGEARQTPLGEFRVVPADTLPPSLVADNQWVVQSRTDPTTDFHALYGFAEQPRVAADLDMANWYTSTRPGTRFKRGLVLARAYRDGRKVTVDNRTLRRVRYGGPNTTRDEETLGSATDLAHVLHDEFGLTVPADDVPPLWQRVEVLAG